MAKPESQAGMWQVILLSGSGLTFEVQKRREKHEQMILEMEKQEGDHTPCKPQQRKTVRPPRRIAPEHLAEKTPAKVPRRKKKVHKISQATCTTPEAAENTQTDKEDDNKIGQAKKVAEEDPNLQLMKLGHLVLATKHHIKLTNRMEKRAKMSYKSVKDYLQKKKEDIRQGRLAPVRRKTKEELLKFKEEELKHAQRTVEEVFQTERTQLKAALKEYEKNLNAEEKNEKQRQKILQKEREREKKFQRAEKQKLQKEEKKQFKENIATETPEIRALMLKNYKEKKQGEKEQIKQLKEDRRKEEQIEESLRHARQNNVRVAKIQRIWEETTDKIRKIPRRLRNKHVGPTDNMVEYQLRQILHRFDDIEQCRIYMRRKLENWIDRQLGVYITEKKKIFEDEWKKMCDGQRRGIDWRIWLYDPDNDTGYGIEYV